MEFTCEKNDLVRGVAIVERAVSRNDNMQVLEGILIKAQDDGLQLIATNLEMSIECFVPAQVKQSGSAVLAGKVLGQIVRKLAGDEVTYTTKENKAIRLQSGKSTFTVYSMDAEDFPTLPDVEEETMCQISQSDLHRMIRHTAFAAASDDARPYLTGVLVEVEGDNIVLVATDSSRLSYVKGKLSQPATSDMKGIVPVSSLAELMRILDSDDSAEVEFAVTSSQAVFRLAGVRMISRVIEGQFPDYNRVFPEESQSKFTIGRQQLLAAVERASLIARRNAPIVRLKVEEGVLSLSSNEAEVGEAFEQLEILQQGADQETAYQARYLLDVLRAMDADEIEVNLGEGLRQGTLRAVDDDSFIYIVMPVRVG